MDYKQKRKELMQKENEMIKEIKKSDLSEEDKKKKISEIIEKNNKTMKEIRKKEKKENYENNQKKILPMKFITIFGVAVLFVTLINLGVMFVIKGGFDTYATYEEEHITSLTTLLSQKEDEYILYFYKEECSACKVVRRSIFEYARNSKTKLYFVDTDDFSSLQTTGEVGSWVGIDEWDKIKIQYTPSIMRVEKIGNKGRVTDGNYGSDGVREFLSKY